MTMANVLLAGLMGGLKQYGAQRDEEKRKEEADEEARLAAAADEARAKRLKEWGLSIEAPSYKEYAATRDGREGKVQVRQTYVPGKGWQEEEIGFEPRDRKAPTTRTIRQGGDEVTQEFDPATGEFREIGRGPKFKPGTGGGSSGKPEKAPKATALTASQADSLFGEVGEDGAVGIDPNKARQFAAYQARNAQRDPRYRDATFAAQQWANQVGFDPNEKLPGTIDADTPIMASTAPAAPAPPKAAPPAAPAPKGTPYPDGTKLKGPDGRMYVVRNGQPVPA
jgi:hypothetical protein